jgi:hypothetical protein
LSFLKSSPFGLINPPNGNALRVYSVQSLSLNSVSIFGGIHNQNSYTFTQNFLAKKKCPASCKIIKIKNDIIQIRIYIGYLLSFKVVAILAILFYKAIVNFLT